HPQGERVHAGRRHRSTRPNLRRHPRPLFPGPMIDVAAATAGLAGAWRLARLDRNGMRYFEATLDGFWRSFQAAAVAAPIYLILVLLRTDDHPLSSDPVRATLIEAIGYVIDWTAFPLAAWYLCRLP